MEHPLSNRAIEALVKKYTKAFKSNKSMSPTQTEAYQWDELNGAIRGYSFADDSTGSYVDSNSCPLYKP